MIAPITLRRIQGRGSPKNADKVTTPSKMENAGASVKIAVEPMVNAGTSDTYTLDDGWTVKTADHKLSCHFEHTIAITEDGYEIMTTL